MLTANVNQIKTNLSYYLNLVQKGKKVIIAKRNVPIAEIKPLNKETAKRVIGQCKENFEIPGDFFDPLPKQVIDAFNNPK